MNLRINPYLSGYIIISIFIIIMTGSMWILSVDYSKEKSSVYGIYYNATNWLSLNLKENQTALLPNTQVFWSLDESLIQQTKDYEHVWKLSGVILRANITDAEILDAQNHLLQYIKNDSKLEYLVIDWVDRYGVKYFKPKNCEVFDKNLKEIEKFVVEVPTDDGKIWKAKIVICKVIKN